MIDTFRVVCAAISQHDTLPQIKKEKKERKKKKLFEIHILYLLRVQNPSSFILK